MNEWIKKGLVVVASLSLLAGASEAVAAEVTLKAINAFQEGTYTAQNFEDFVKKVNEEGKGLVHIQYLGGPKAIPTMEQAAALRNGVVDMAATTAAYSTGIVPEVLALNFATVPFQQLRTNGGLDYINRLMGEKNLMYFARTGDGVKYHLYLAKPITHPDLKGMKIRATPNFREFFLALGATVIQTPPGEIYTAMERGVVDGYGLPLVGIFDMGLQQVTKYRVEPGFHNMEMAVQFNLKSWEKLTPEQRAFLEKQREWLEKMALEKSLHDAESERKRQEAAGIKEIHFSPSEKDEYIRKSQDTAWDGIIKISPKHGPILKKFLAP